MLSKAPGLSLVGSLNLNGHWTTVVVEIDGPGGLHGLFGDLTASGFVSYSGQDLAEESNLRCTNQAFSEKMTSETTLMAISVALASRLASFSISKRVSEGPCSSTHLLIAQTLMPATQLATPPR